MKLFGNQPRSFYLVFFLEIWERFGYYGLTALLVLYMVQELHYTDMQADILFATFSAIVYLLPGIGGYIGDRLLGTKRTILIGAVVLAFGYFLFVLPFLPSQGFVWPLAMVALGTSLFKANPSSLLSKVYEGTTYNKDSGFTLYYMAINLGSVVSMTLTPILNKYFGWHVAFSACAVGLLLAIANYWGMRHTVATIGSEPDLKPVRKDYLFYVAVGCVFALIGAHWLLLHPEVMSWILGIGIVVLLGYFVYETLHASKEESKGMVLFIFLFIQAIVFFVSYFQMPMSLNLFILRNVEHSILGISVETAQFQALNAFWILMMSPILAMFYQKLSMRGKDLSLPLKFSLGMMLAGVAYLILPVAALTAHHGIISSGWVVLSYFLFSTGELLISALGLSLVARYVPQRLMGYTMGLWFLATSIASLLAGKVSSLANVPSELGSNPELSLPIYSHVFLQLGVATIGVAIVMLALVPYLRKLSQ